MSSLYLPGVGMVNLTAMRVHQAVVEYDERLIFSQHPENGQWCIFMKMPSDYETAVQIDGNNVLPLLGFRDIPHPEDAVKRLWEADTLRQGEQWLDEMNRRNEKLKKSKAVAADEATEQAAEALEWFNRQAGTHPQARIFVPGKDE
jgi:hypothetical protein